MSKPMIVRVLLVITFPIWIVIVCAEAICKEWPRFANNFKNGTTK